MSEIINAIDATQEIVAEVSPAPLTFERQTSALDLKARLDWGEPAFTIIDVRDRESFNDKRIQGAIHCTADELVKRVQQTLEPNRDIYVYADEAGAAINAASRLDQAGYKKVAILEDGIRAWLAASGVVEGRQA